MDSIGHTRTSPQLAGKCLGIAVVSNPTAAPTAMFVVCYAAITMPITTATMATDVAVCTSDPPVGVYHPLNIARSQVPRVRPSEIVVMVTVGGSQVNSFHWTRTVRCSDAENRSLEQNLHDGHVCMCVGGWVSE